jgi:MbtH protein
VLNALDDDIRSFLVLINDEGQHSLWPAAAAVPSGWLIGFGPDRRGTCMKFIEQNWVDMSMKGSS